MFGKLLVSTALGAAVLTAAVPTKASAQSFGVWVGSGDSRSYDDDERRETWIARQRWEQQQRWEAQQRWEREEARRRYWQHERWERQEQARRDWDGERWAHRRDWRGEDDEDER